MSIELLLLILMTVGIVLIKIFWIASEIKYFKQRLNWTMLKTNLVEAFILFLQILVVFILPLPKTPFDGFILWFGFALYLVGVVLAVWGRLTMNSVWGIPSEHHKQQNRLVTDGPFAFSRNPIYVGFILIYFGFCIAIKSWLIVLRIPLLIYFYKSAHREEKLLEKTFGKEYSDYKKRVPLFLLK